MFLLFFFCFVLFSKSSFFYAKSQSNKSFELPATAVDLFSFFVLLFFFSLFSRSEIPNCWCSLLICSFCRNCLIVVQSCLFLLRLFLLHFFVVLGTLRLRGVRSDRRRPESSHKILKFSSSFYRRDCTPHVSVYHSVHASCDAPSSTRRSKACSWSMWNRDWSQSCCCGSGFCEKKTWH